MIVVDTSPLIAIVLGETHGDACLETISAEPRVLISAGTMAEAMIVAGQGHKTEALVHLFEGLDLEIIPATAKTARQIGEAYAKWGKGNHPARLNFGDCFAYVLAKEHGIPLLYIGDDFAKTDVASIP